MSQTTAALADMTNAQLRDLAAERGIKTTTKMNKAQLLEAIEADNMHEPIIEPEEMDEILDSEVVPSEDIWAEQIAELEEAMASAFLTPTSVTDEELKVEASQIETGPLPAEPGRYYKISESRTRIGKAHLTVMEDGTLTYTNRRGETVLYSRAQFDRKWAEGYVNLNARQSAERASVSAAKPLVVTDYSKELFPKALRESLLVAA